MQRELTGTQSELQQGAEFGEFVCCRARYVHRANCLAAVAFILRGPYSSCFRTVQEAAVRLVQRAQEV